ncbi:hypothetical protein PPSIR1_41454 [Plesiocystis pacifica SIR-1]|uniref:ORC1/DEAH AAA+ ATPase domain-containing protein n=1 Tax=Plesiocystis pacifica SIR-1 TaxID=391625 RepID=A6GDH9_9BACT|nr:hypothetical protein PPSIR1_41454 [Plesiocystis pacifica SIR-1]
MTNLNPASLRPDEHVNRDREAQWLKSGLTAFLRAQSPLSGDAFCVLGDKGMGKSLLTRKVFDDLRRTHAATVLLLEVDCRPLRNQRHVYREIGRRLVDELGYRTSVPSALKAAARSFGQLARFETLSLSEAHEQLIGNKIELGLESGEMRLFGWLRTRLNIGLERSSQVIRSLQGKVQVDGPQLQEALFALLHDIVTQTELRVVVHLDNLEELNHEAMLDESTRELVRADVEALLHLSEAPMALVLTMRTYYSSVLTRRIQRRQTLRPLGVEDHLEIFRRRAAMEPTDIQRALEDPSLDAGLSRLAAEARTPLAFLEWTRYLLEEGRLDEEEPLEVLRARLDSHYAQIAPFIPKVASLFDSLEEVVPFEAIHRACDGRDVTVRQLQELQVILPRNYWDPQDFLLDPQLGFLLASAFTSS